MEGDWFQMVGVQDVLSQAPPTLRAPHVPLAHHTEGEVAQGGEVSTGTDRTLVGNEWETGCYKCVCVCVCVCAIVYAEIFTRKK